MLADTDTLLTIAEIAATFAGFSALISVLGQRRGSAAPIHDLLRLRLVISTSVLAVAGALIPVGIANFGFPARAAWAASAACFLLLTYGVIHSFFRSYRPVRGHVEPDYLAFAVATALEVGIQIALISILLGAFPASHYGLYVTALTFTLGQAAFVFMRLVESTFGPDLLR